METLQCPHCGTANPPGRSLCVNCQTPLTAYAGELRGEAYQGKLAGQVEQIGGRPLSVWLMIGFLIFVAAAWPLRAVAMALLGRAHLNSDSTNYIAAAFGAIAPIMTAVVCLPIAALLLWCAWAAHSQHVRAWSACMGAVIVFAAYALIRAAEYRWWTAVWVVAAAALAFGWSRGSTRAWFGLT